MLESTPTSANWAVSGPQQEPHAWPKLAPAGADFLTLRQQGYLMVDKTARCRCWRVNATSFWPGQAVLAKACS